MSSPWYPTAASPAPEGVMLDTKIDDAHGIRNEQQLRRQGNLWWTGSKGEPNCMYVYYTPTHWRVP